MAGQALFFRTCNLISNSRGLFNLRSVHVNLLPSARSLKQDTRERLKLLDIPEKPKKPSTPYFKFITENRAKVIKENPNLKQTEIIKKCAEYWKNVSAELKEKYTAAYKSEREEYNEKILNFNANLTPEQRDALNEVDQEKKSDRKKRKIKKIYKETHKPKRPTAPYTCYILEQSKIRNISVKYLMTSLKDEWAKLPEAERAKFQIQFKEEKEKYEKAMAEWEAKMIQEGKEDLVRVKSLDAPRKPSRIKELKKDDPQ